MYRLKLLSLSIGCAGIVAGCVSIQQSAQQPQTVRPFASIRHAGTDAQAKYDLGRYYAGQSRHEEAKRALEEALVLDPALSRACNLLGVIHAGEGRYEDAIARFRQAVALEPAASHLHNNLGYAQLLQGRNEEALASFERALRLEPGNEKARDNRRIARVRLSDGEMGPAPSGGEKTGDAAESASAAGARQPGGSEASLVKLVALAPNVYELVIPAQAGAPRAAAMQAASADRSAKPARTGIEIANGNGVTGMARQVARFLKARTVTVARLTNSRPFNQEKTRIEYRLGFHTEAQELDARLPRRAMLVESSMLRRGVDVRLVLGKDVSTDVALFDATGSGLSRLALRRP